MSDLVSQRSASQLFRDWWAEHLWAALPARLREPSLRTRRPARVALAGDRYWPEGAAASEGRALTTAPAGAEVVLLLGEDNGFRRTVTLPISVHHAVKSVLAHDLDRLTPLRANDLYHDARVIERDWQRSTCTALLVAVPRARVKQQIEAIEARGLAVRRVVLSDADLALGIDLSPPERKIDSPTARGRWLTVVLALLCLLLLAAIATFPIWQARERVIALQAQEGQLRIEAERVSVLQRQVEKQLAEYNFLLARKHSQPLLVQVLEDLSKRLPDDTWVQTLEVKSNPQTKAREVIIQGETGSGARLLSILQESPLLKEPAMKAAMTRLAPNAERFHLGGELVQAQLPDKIRPTEAASALTVAVPVAPAQAAGAPTAGPSRSGDGKVGDAKGGESKPPERPAEKGTSTSGAASQSPGAPISPGGAKP